MAKKEEVKNKVEKEVEKEQLSEQQLENQILGKEEKEEKVEKSATKPNKMEVDTDSFQQILNRLNELEAREAMLAKSGESDVFDPLQINTEQKTCRISFFYVPETGDNHLVLAYIPRIKADGSEQLTWSKWNEDKKEMRIVCSLKLRDEKGVEYDKVDVDYLDFLESLSTKSFPIKERIDVGKPVKQDMTIQKLWNGKTLEATPIRVQTGYKAQKFEFSVDVNGEVIKFKDNVINIK